MENEITAGRAAMPEEPISQEAARAMLAALRTADLIAEKGYTREAADAIGRHAFSAYMRGGAHGLLRWERETRRAAIALAERGA